MLDGGHLSAHEGGKIKSTRTTMLMKSEIIELITFLIIFLVFATMILLLAFLFDTSSKSFLIPPTTSPPKSILTRSLGGEPDEVVCKLYSCSLCSLQIAKHALPS